MSASTPTTTGEKVLLAQLQGPAAVIDVRHVASKQNGVSPWITAQHVRDWEAQHGALNPGDVSPGFWDEVMTLFPTIG